MPYKDPAQQREYQRVWQQEVQRRRREEWFVVNGPCAYCDSWKNLQLDHKDPTQKVSHRIWSWSEVRRLSELKKCQALCHTCHKIKSATECARGEANGSSKLTEQDVREIRMSDDSLRTLGQRYGVAHNVIDRIKRGLIWKHVV